ncbi:nucleotidyltransferase family protein [Methylobacterium planeticum]|uniref:Nucleotidyltransferase family protein n=1 Tax=Methylobacterium planeticum TaxID=2615211 RepID=A0A6N6MX47_9HYPH|nr:nucleotidyltransferase family protein [Methylobacterium planeticum]KAB1075296.1 nucleotidyltransferase family protein [Methylobacterium planeticum]
MPEAAVATVLLAAGRGTRFGTAPKLLADLDGRPLVRHAAEAALAASARPVVVVLGAHAQALRTALAGLDLVLVENPDYAAGLSTSLRAGLAALPAAIPGALVLLGDMPRVTPAQLDRLVAAFAAADPRPAAVVPVHAGRRGNPVLLNRHRLAPDLARLSGDRGAGPILAGRTDVLEIPGDAGTALDIDTPAALAGLGGD